MSTPDRFLSGGAIDLGEVKARAEARAQAEERARARAAAPDGAPQSVELTTANLETEVLARSQSVPVVVLLGSQRAPESETLQADLAEIVSARGGDLAFVHGDIDAYPQLAQVFGISAIPTVVAVAAGRPVTHFAGPQPREALEKWCEQLVIAIAPSLSGAQSPEAAPAEAEAAAPQAPAGDPLLDPAIEHLNNGEFDKAIEVYKEALAKKPGDKEIIAAMHTAEMLQRLDQREGPNADPLVAADVAINEGDLEWAFDYLIERFSGPRKKEAHQRLLDLFTLFDASDPRVSAARTKMASALF